MYYIEETDKPLNWFNKAFPRVKLIGNKIYITGLNEESKEKKSIKLSKKVDKILKRTKSNKLVLSKEIQKNDAFQNMLYTYGYDIAKGDWLFEGLSANILDYIVNNKKIIKEECQTSVLVNELKDYTLHNIKILASNFKNLNIVTSHIEKFKNIEQNIMDENGLIITVTNNKKKSLLKSRIILNIDFPSELLNKYNIFDEAIIVNIHNKVKINKKRFNGLIINDYDISVCNEIIEQSVGMQANKYFTKQVYEANFYKNMTFQDFYKKIKKDKCKITQLFCLNGTV